MGQVRYTAQISLPTTVVQQAPVLPPTTPQHCPPYNRRLLPYNASVARLCALCLPHYLPDAYLPILIESDEGQIEKALNTRMFRCYLYSPATNVTLSRCPFLCRKCLLQSSLWEVSPPVHTDKLLGTSESIICDQHLDFSTKPTCRIDMKIQVLFMI